MMFKLLDEKHLTDNPSDIFRGVSQSLVKIYIVTLDWRGGGFLKMFIIPILLSNLLYNNITIIFLVCSHNSIMLDTLVPKTCTWGEDVS